MAQRKRALDPARDGPRLDARTTLRLPRDSRGATISGLVRLVLTPIRPHGCVGRAGASGSARGPIALTARDRLRDGWRE